LQKKIRNHLREAKEIREDPETRLFRAWFTVAEHTSFAPWFVLDMLSQAVGLPNMLTYTAARGL
jgi:hypothetical protein